MKISNISLFRERGTGTISCLHFDLKAPPIKKSWDIPSCSDSLLSVLADPVTYRDPEPSHFQRTRASIYLRT